MRNCMLKNSVRSLVLVLGVVFLCLVLQQQRERRYERDEAVTGGTTTTGGASATGGKTGGSASATGGTTATGGASATGGTSATASASASGGSSAAGGASAAGGSATTGGVMSSGGDTAAGGGTGTSTMTLAQACAKNCAFAVGALDVAHLLHDNRCVRPELHDYVRQHVRCQCGFGTAVHRMMVCVATDPAFSSSADFVCAKPNSPLNLWSPAGTRRKPDSTCEDKIVSGTATTPHTGTWIPGWTSGVPAQVFTDE
jgi:hypothetical protein